MKPGQEASFLSAIVAVGKQKNKTWVNSKFKTPQECDITIDNEQVVANFPAGLVAPDLEDYRGMTGKEDWAVTYTRRWKDPDAFIVTSTKAEKLIAERLEDHGENYLLLLNEKPRLIGAEGWSGLAEEMAARAPPRFAQPEGWKFGFEEQKLTSTEDEALKETMDMIHTVLAKPGTMVLRKRVLLMLSAAFGVAVDTDVVNGIKQDAQDR
jgi:hypothetical protein